MSKARGSQGCSLCPFRIRVGQEILYYKPSSSWVHAFHFKEKGKQEKIPFSNNAGKWLEATSND